jgi:type I restriction enzyme, S subunit
MTVELKPGYKQTEVGVIPDDWQDAPLPDIVWFQEGPGLRNWQFKPNGLKVINVTNLQENGYLDLSRTERHISWEEFEKMYKHFLIDDSDVVVASSGNSYCKTAVVRQSDLPLLMNTSVIRFKAKKGIVRSYMLIYLKSKYFKDQIDLMITGGAQPNFGPAHLSKVLIPIPPTKAEQEAIAEALSDTDALIETLGQLITKKRHIKQGAMQELLTGKKRLPGFSGKWELKSLSDLFNISGGFSASRDQLSTEGHCYLHYGDIHKSAKTYIDVRAEYQDIPKLEVPLKRISPVSLLEDGDVVFVDASEDDEGASKHIVIINKDKIPYISGLHTIVAKCKINDLDHLYRRYCFQTTAIKRQFYFFAVGTKVSGISKTNIAKVTLPLPSFPNKPPSPLSSPTWMPR